MRKAAAAAAAAEAALARNDKSEVESLYKLIKLATKVKSKNGC